MFKRSLSLLTVFCVMFLLLWGCSKSNHGTLAFVGDESDMKTCYQIYPEEYFPNVINPELREGRFPPDIVGEYEMRGHLVDESFAIYYPTTSQTIPFHQVQETSLYIIIKDQINGMAKIKIGAKNNSNEYQWFDETNAYIYGNVNNNDDDKDDNNDSQRFMLCYETLEDKENTPYKVTIGNIITGTIDTDGIKDVDYWYVFKQVTVSNSITPYPLEGGYAYYHADIAAKKVK